MSQSYKLTPEDVRFFHDEGYLGPYTMYSPEEMDQIRPIVEHEIFETEGPFHVSRQKSRHLDNRTIYDLCTHPTIMDRVEGILGPDIVLWQSNFFNKNPGAKEIPWHQDMNFWSNEIEPGINVSAWLAIDDTDVTNSCVQLMPRSHRKTVPHIKATPEQAFREQGDPDHIGIDPERVVKMEIQAGQFFLFTERMLHYSAANTSDRRRLGLTIRITIPIVRCYKTHHVHLVRGEDRMGFNLYGDAPE